MILVLLLIYDATTTSVVKPFTTLSGKRTSSVPSACTGNRIATHNMKVEPVEPQEFPQHKLAVDGMKEWIRTTSLACRMCRSSIKAYSGVSGSWLCGAFGRDGEVGADGAEGEAGAGEAEVGEVGPAYLGGGCVHSCKERASAIERERER